MKKKMQIIHVMIWLCIVIFSIIACTNNQQPKTKLESIDYPLTIKDSFEREVCIEKEPSRVISLAPSITEIIFAIGSEEKLVGRTEYCDYPKEVSDIDIIGNIEEPNIEKMVELEPDIVIAATHFKKEALEKLETLGIPVIILYDGENFEEVYKVIKTIGEIFNRFTEAENVIHNMKQKVEEVMDKVKDQEKPSVYYVVGFGEYGDYTAGGDTFIGKMIEMAGGENVAKEVDGWTYSLEKLVEQDPDILICSKYFDSKAGIEKANGYKELSAVKEGRLYEMDNDLLDRPGTRLADGLEELARLIHPNMFK